MTPSNCSRLMLKGTAEDAQLSSALAHWRDRLFLMTIAVGITSSSSAGWAYAVGAP